MNPVKLHTGMLLLCLLGLAGLAGYVASQPKNARQGYILNQQAFRQFKGTKILETKLDQLKRSQQQQLDSLRALAPHTTAWQQEMKQRNAFAQQALSEQYTADIWKQINQYAAQYGEQEGYDFIFGATGDGNLMYARDSRNVTEDFIHYLNEKYDGNP